MLTGLLLTLSLLLPFCMQAADATAREIAPGVWVWQGDRDKREPANLTLVIFRDYALVIDGNFPWGARELLPKIKAVTSKPIRYVFDTHYHGDHAFGNSLYADAGATIVLSRATDSELRTKGAASWNHWHESHSLEGARLEPASITFSESMAFDDGTQRVELIRLGPAHTKGDAVAYLPKAGMVATGDLCVTWGFGNNLADADADYEGWLGALHRMLSWDVRTVVPGHGPVSDRSALATERDYLSDMLNQVRTGLKAGKTPDQLAQEMNLSSHGTIAGSSEANATSIRVICRHLQGTQ